MCRILLVALTASVSVVSAHGRTQTADELAARFVAATGGAGAWEAVQTLEVRSRSEYYSFDLAVKKPNRIRLDAWSDGHAGNDTRAFDGTSGWRINTNEGTSKPRSMSAAEIDELRTDRDWMMELADYKTRGYRLERAGTESVAGRPAHKLKLTRPDGSIVYILLDEKTSLEVRRIRPSQSPDGQAVDIVIDVSDYRAVGKLLLPHRAGPATREYVVNGAIDDGKFRMPRTAEAEMARARLDAAVSQLLAIGTAAPEWMLKDGSGHVHRSADYLGRVVVMDFWAVWCAPCHAMMPGLQQLHRELSPRGVAVLGISTFEKNADPVQLFRDRGYDYPVLLNGDAIAGPFRVKGLPTVYVVGIDGRIIDASTGADAAAEITRRRAIDAHLNQHGRTTTDAQEARGQRAG